MTSRAEGSTAPSRARFWVVLVGGPAVVVVGLWYFFLRPATLLDQLLAGADVEVSSFVFTGQQQKVVMNDPESVAYLTKAFRSAAPKQYVSGHCGLVYTMEVHFTGGCSFRAGCYVPEENGLTVSPNWHTLILDDAYFHWVAFPEPIPERVQAALRNLRTPPGP
jgi:hypothetical protein